MKSLAFAVRSTNGVLGIEKALAVALLAGSLSWLSGCSPAEGGGSQLNASEEKMYGWDRDSSFLLGAPHAGYDSKTAAVADAFCEDVAWNCVIAKNFRTKEEQNNVNRPTEGAERRPQDEVVTTRAVEIHGYYTSAIAQFTAGDKLKLYVELHANSRSVNKGQLEIAVVGLSDNQRKAVKRKMKEALEDAGLSTAVRVEGLDSIDMTAAAAKANGTLGSLGVPALHLEFHSSTMANTNSVTKAVKKGLKSLQANF